MPYRGITRAGGIALHASRHDRHNVQVVMPFADDSCIVHIGCSSHDGRIFGRQAHFVAHSVVVSLHSLPGDEFEPGIMPRGLAGLMIEEMANALCLPAIACRGAEGPMRDCQINNEVTATPANYSVLQAGENLPVGRGLLRRAGSMILH